MRDNKHGSLNLSRRGFLGQGLAALGAAGLSGAEVPRSGGQEPESRVRVEPPDWFAGDMHMHRGICCARANAKDMLTPQELLEGMKANDLAVMSVLGDIGDGETRYVERDIPLVTGHDNPASTPSRLLHWDGEVDWDPVGVTFDKFLIGGHLVLLGLKGARRIYAEYTYPIIQWATEQGGIAGFAHMQYLPLAFYPPPDGIPTSLDCCTPLEYPVEVALGSVSFVSEDVRGSDSALQAYYRLLNTGFRPGLAAGTDYPCNNLEPFGTCLTYVRIPDGKLTYEKWIDGIARGRTVVSRNAHNEFLDFKVNESAHPGDEIRLEQKGPVRVRVEWRSLNPGLGRIEVVQNGAVVVSQTTQVAPVSSENVKRTNVDGHQQPSCCVASGASAVLETTLEFRQSGWLAARRMDWQTGHQTQTGAVFVLAQGAPIRASAADARFFVSWIDNLLKQTSPGGKWSGFFKTDREPAHQRYRQARAIFLQRAAEAEKQVAESGS